MPYIPIFSVTVVEAIYIYINIYIYIYIHIHMYNIDIYVYVIYLYIRMINYAYIYLALTRPVYSRSGRFHAGLRMHLFRHILGCRHIIICCLCGIAGAWHTSSGKLETKYLRHCII